MVAKEDTLMSLIMIEKDIDDFDKTKEYTKADQYNSARSTPS